MGSDLVVIFDVPRAAAPGDITLPALEFANPLREQRQSVELHQGFAVWWPGVSVREIRDQEITSAAIIQAARQIAAQLGSTCAMFMPDDIEPFCEGRYQLVEGRKSLHGWRQELNGLLRHTEDLRTMAEPKTGGGTWQASYGCLVAV